MTIVIDNVSTVGGWIPISKTDTYTQTKIQPQTEQGDMYQSSDLGE